MRKFTIAISVFVAALPLLGQDASKPSQVTIGLNEYETLRHASDTPSATVIDTIRLSGGFGSRDLAVTIAGRATGTRPLVKALTDTTDVTIAGCKGEAILSRSGKGAFDVIPLANTFELRCDLRISGSDRLRMHVTPAVLDVRSSVTDGELVSGDEDDSGARDYTLVRHVTGAEGTLAATATGRYLITLLPDATRFRYAIDVHNPNRATSTLELTLVSNEHLQQIDSAAPYEVTGNRYVFSIPPGDSAITLTGELRGTSFTAPVRASLQYLVLESHPLLRPTVQTPAKRISLGESGVETQYRGALAFETGSERITWNVARLEALHAISYAVNQASHTLFVPIDGPVLGQSTFALRNEGAAELVLPARPEPSYVSFDEEPMLMTKNAAGELTVPLSPGEQTLLVQHRQPLHRTLGIAYGSLAVPQLSVPATNTGLVMSYPSQWVPLYEDFASRATLWSPSAGQIALFLVLAIWIERLLAWLTLGARRRFTIALLTALAATIVTSFLILVVMAFGALTMFWIATRTSLKQKIAAAALVIVVVLIVLVGYVGRINSLSETSYRSAEVSTASAKVGELNRAQPPAPAPEAPAQAYQGLPAKFTLPNGERWSSFSQELLRVDRPQTAHVVLLSLVLAHWIGLAIALLAIGLLWRERQRIKDAIRAQSPTPVAENFAADAH